MSIPANKEEAAGFLARLRSATPARIGLARTGPSIQTSDQLAFQLAHAQARDAVSVELDPEPLMRGLAARKFQGVEVTSQAHDRQTYLTRPDLGRRLDRTSLENTISLNGKTNLIFVIADGLSARAVQENALPLLDAALPMLLRGGWQVGPVFIARQARVALGDELGELLGACMVIVLIGERPGLSSPNSMGVYLTWEPKIGTMDSARNCLSNIQPQGMSCADAARKLAWLCAQARRSGMTGVDLKEETAPALEAIDPVSPGG